MRSGAYHYLLVSFTLVDFFRSQGDLNRLLQCLLGHYTPESCPLYLTPAGFSKLQEGHGELLDSFRLHTDSIIKYDSPVLAERRCADYTIPKAS
jgi:hypothetical protein